MEIKLLLQAWFVHDILKFTTEASIGRIESWSKIGALGVW
jgi:hypothetical protein